ncbi:ParA family protein [Candidatus Venteria ishoeyi]|uniref:Sporulation initiation inhibitor protein Soj n=1 Tax=Candidatus Venteria ishoeyi TaxID=1899563 RepID=A0A1H6FCG5_9GAMM|nr:AAA family ATPase [Candidatus Venteria ishoeyi]MDM8544959.1 AAA family ATPase [Candidatus Venteria ishoeyi]SEH07780.1 Sporulation initiation inhibitor protein Soj [Candidatus Venteria ishoeyi]
MKIIASYSIKGGVGKTSTAVNLAWQAAQEGANTLIWDLDPQAAASFYFRIKPKIKGGTKKLLKPKSVLDNLIKGTDYLNLDLLPADFSYRHMELGLNEQKHPTQQLLRLLRPLTQEYDYIFLDCPPTLTLVSENIFQAADIMICPVIPTTLSLRTLQQLEDFCNDNNLKHLSILPFFSMVDRRKKMHQQIIETFKPQGLFLNQQIAYASDIEKMGLRRAAVGDYAASSQAAKSYQSLWQEIQQRW